MVPNQYFSDLQKHEPLSRADEGQLTARLKRRPSKRDRDRLITSNLRYVVKVASSYRDCGMPLEDLINEGNIGLIEAVSRFDPTRGTRFLTYARWWIQKAILSALSKKSLVRIPSHRQKEVRIARQEEKLLLEGSGDPAKLSADLERVAEKRESLMDARPVELSLEDVWGRDDERPVDDLMPSQSAVDPEMEMIRGETKDTVERAMAHLSSIERTIIRERFGMDDTTPRTLKEIGVDLGLSRERVRQLEVQSREKMLRAVTRKPGRGTRPTARERPPARAVTKSKYHARTRLKPAS